jgi:hypothetical protein
MLLLAVLSSCAAELKPKIKNVAKIFLIVG